MKNLRYAFLSQKTLDESLMRAITQNNIQKIIKLLSSGANPDANAAGPTVTGPTPLIHAATLNEKVIVEILLKAGADPTRERHDTTAAQRAFRMGHVQLSERLVQAEIEWNKKHGKPAVAASAQKITALAASLAAQQKEEAKAKEKKDWELLLREAIHAEDTNFIKGVFSEKIFDQNTEWKEFLIDPLITAIRCHKQKSVTALMETGWNATTSLQRYPGLVGETPLLQALLKLGADPLAKNEKGETSIETARRYGHHTSEAMIEMHLQKTAQNARIKALEEEIRTVRQQLTEKNAKSGGKPIRKMAKKSRMPGK